MISSLEAKRLAQCLTKAGWDCDTDWLAQRLELLPPGADLLPLVGGNWGQAKLTIGWPNEFSAVDESWIGRRLMFWASGIPSGRRVAWISSRLGRAIDERSDWFGVLRTAAAKFDRNHDLLLTASDTTTDRFLERAAVLFDMRLLRFQFQESRSLTDWLRSIQKRTKWDAEFDPTISNVNVSPLVGDSANDEWGNLPLADRVIVSAADQLIALQVRSGGHLHELLQRRLQQATHQPGSVWLALGDALVPTNIAQELQSLGAVGWVLTPGHETNAPLHNSMSSSPAATVLAIDERTFRNNSLVHWTRQRHGPWPDQTEDEFVDELLLAQHETSHSAFASLVRIVRQKRLIGSASGIRGGTPVVSLSAVSLLELPDRRIFRGHRGRWDFECYGLCLRRDWLVSCGARPVRYGDDSHWSSLSDDDRPYFQLRETRSRRGTRLIDWSRETEWRVVGDLDLSQAPRDAISLFVPTDIEARQLAAICPWPIIVLSNSRAD